MGFSTRRRAQASILATAGVLILGLQTLQGTAAQAFNHHSGGGATGCTDKVDSSLHGLSSRATDVIVTGSSATAVAAAVTAAGGRVVSAQPMVGGVRATLPGNRLSSLACAASILSVTPNRGIQFQSASSISAGQTGSAFAKTTGANSMWTSGNTGRVGVAVIDTGISPMPDLAGRVVWGPDLSGEGTIIDSYGHGTVMAGVIAGDGHDSDGAAWGAYTGMAPGATLISVKVAGRNGATDVSTVLEAMHWVAAYKNQYNIRVVNLSWGTRSTQSTLLDPLNYAVERLWKLGIVVVVAAGNSGPDHGTILKPADDPMVITTGAYDDNGTTSLSDDSMSQWSSQGPTFGGLAKPDLVAPGRSLISQRSYGSQIEAQHAGSLVVPSYIRGSGTSQAAAVTSGAIALLLQARPNLTPDQVKKILTDLARPMSGTSSYAQGDGRLTLNGALTAWAGLGTQQLSVATGLGSLDLSRGGRHVQLDCGEDGLLDVILGETTADCQTWNPVTWTGSSWTGSSWTGSSWTGSSWTGSSWTGSSWTGGEWTGSSWTGGEWTGSSWTGSSWTGSSWTGSSWTGSSWTSDEWADDPTPNEFLTVFWGNRPMPYQQVVGEESG